MADAKSLHEVKPVFFGNSITGFRLPGEDPWIPGRRHGRRVRDESSGGAVAANGALNDAISGEHDLKGADGRHCTDGTARPARCR